MSIDRIGKAPGVTGGSAAGGVTPASGKGAFEVEKSASTAATGATKESSPADRVRAGELDIHGYIDIRVNEATQHLEGKLGPADMEKVKEHLRSQIAQDPTLQEMVKAATGITPPADEG